jgi:hypothetical protein
MRSFRLSGAEDFGPCGESWSWACWAAVKVAVLAGRAHPYESGNAAVMRPAIEMLKGAGIETLILTNAAGSLKPEMRPGSIMLITDHINYSGMNPLIGQHGDENFVPMTDAYDPALRARFLPRRKPKDVPLHQGVYCWYSGPSFETPAEIRMFQIIGGTGCGHVHRARNDPRAALRAQGRGAFRHHQSRCRDRGRIAQPRGDEARRRQGRREHEEAHHTRFFRDA